jgi:hypothetical protein
MNKLQLRQNLEVLLGYYDCVKDGNGQWTRTESPTCPGHYYVDGEQFKPAFFMEGDLKVPTNWNPQGLETVMEEEPRTDAFEFAGGFQERWQRWTVWIRQWDLDKNLSKVEVALRRHFGGNVNFSNFIENDNVIPNRLKVTILTKDWDLSTYVDGSQVMNPPSPIENSPVETYFDQ